MSVFMIFRIALKALGRNKMRTALTMLGMIIGVAAVITMVALGTGAQSSIDAQIQTMGTNTIQVQAGNFTQGGVRQGQGNASTLTPDDATAISQVPGVLYTAASQQTRGQMVAGNLNWNTQMEGTDIDFPLINSWPVEQGSFFTDQDVTQEANVGGLGRGAGLDRPRPVVRTRGRSSRPDDSHPASAVHHHRGHGEQRTVGG